MAYGRGRWTVDDLFLSKAVLISSKVFPITMKSIVKSPTPYKADTPARVPLACVASVSARVNEQKMEREQTNKREGGALAPNFHAITRAETLVTQAKACF